MSNIRARFAAHFWPTVGLTFALGVLGGYGIARLAAPMSSRDAYAACLLKRIKPGMGSDAVQSIEFGCAQPVLEPPPLS